MHYPQVVYTVYCILGIAAIRAIPTGGILYSVYYMYSSNKGHSTTVKADSEAEPRADVLIHSQTLKFARKTEVAGLNS